MTIFNLGFISFARNVGPWGEMQSKYQMTIFWLGNAICLSWWGVRKSISHWWTPRSEEKSCFIFCPDLPEAQGMPYASSFPIWWTSILVCRQRQWVLLPSREAINNLPMTGTINLLALHGKAALSGKWYCLPVGSQDLRLWYHAIWIYKPNYTTGNWLNFLEPGFFFYLSIK